MMRCHRCGNSIDTRYRRADGSVVCSGCGAVYRPKAAQAQRPANTSQQEKNQQSRAAQRPAPPAAHSRGAKPRKRKKRFLPIVLLSVFLIIVLVAGGFIIYQKMVNPAFSIYDIPNYYIDMLSGIGRDSNEIENDANDPTVTQKLAIHESDPTTYVIDPDSGTEYVNNEVLLIANDGVEHKAVESYISSFGGMFVGYNTYLNQYQVQFNRAFNNLAELDSLISEIMGSGLFSDAYPNYISHIQSEDFYPNDSYYSPWERNSDNHWNLDAIHVPEMWNRFDFVNRPSIKIGVLDNQFYSAHEDIVFSGLYYGISSHTEFASDVPKRSHGTHVSGTIGATFNNQKGIAGIIPNAEIYGASMLGFEGRTAKNRENEHGLPVVEIQAGLTYLICIKECRVINYSYGETFEDGVTDNEIIEYFERTNIPIEKALLTFLSEGMDFVIVKAAGNEREKQSIQSDAYYDTPSYIVNPAIRNRIIVVGAAERSPYGDIFVADYSDYGDRVDLIAPGSGILSTVYKTNDTHAIEWFFNHSGYDLSSGTSMAAPHVTGVAAAMWSVNPALTGPEIKRIIVDTAQGSYQYRNTSEYAYPMLDALAAVIGASEYERVETEEVTATPTIEISTPARVRYLSQIYPSSFTRYEDNEGDSCVFNLDENGLPGIANEYKRNGNIGVDGIEYDHGFEVWLARWNYTPEESWVQTTYQLDGQYTSLSGKTGLIRSYNTTDFNTTVYFYDGARCLASYTLTPENCNHDINVNLQGVKLLTLRVEDNIAVSGGTSFALSELELGQGSSSDDGYTSSEYDYLGIRYELVNGYDSLGYSNTIEILDIENGVLHFNLDFYRLQGFHNLPAYRNDDNMYYFNDSESGLVGKISLDGGDVILFIEDTPNFYSDSSSTHFLNGAVHTFRTQGAIYQGVVFQMNTDQHYAANIFLSNFAEQRIKSISIDSQDLDQLVNFAIIFCTINQHDTVGVFHYDNAPPDAVLDYYTVSLETVNEVLERHFGIQIDASDASRFPTDGDPNKHYLNGYFYFPAASGERHNLIAMRYDPSAFLDKYVI